MSRPATGSERLRAFTRGAGRGGDGGPEGVLALPVPGTLGERRDALHVERFNRAADALALEVLGVVLLERSEVTALEPLRVDERLDAPELAVGVDAVEREGGAATAALEAGEVEVLGDLAARERVVLLDLGEGQPEHELGDLAGGLVLEAAGLRVELVLALVGGALVPEGLAVVVVELLRVDRHHLEPVLALLQTL